MITQHAMIPDLEYMQEALLDEGIMTNPEDHAINILRDMDSIGVELRKSMSSVIKKATTIQGIGNDLIDLDNEERKEYKPRTVWVALGIGASASSSP